MNRRITQICFSLVVLAIFEVALMLRRQSVCALPVDEGAKPVSDTATQGCGGGASPAPTKPPQGTPPATLITSNADGFLATERRMFAHSHPVDRVSSHAVSMIRLNGRCIDTSRSSEQGWNTRDIAGTQQWLAKVARQTPTTRNMRPYLVQCDGPIQDVWKNNIVDAGGILRGYQPDFAFLVEMTDETAGRVATLGFVRWIGLYAAEYKVQPFLQHLITNWGTLTAGEAAFPISITVLAFTGEDMAGVSNVVVSRGGHVSRTSIGEEGGLVRAEVAPDIVPRLAELPGVEWVEEYVAPVLHNDFAVQGRHLNVTNVWENHGLTGSNQVIGHADTGLDIGTTNGIHPDFAGRIKAVFALGRVNNWRDTDGHGTHTAGSLLGNGQMSGGQFKGVAWQAQIVHQSVLDSGGGFGGLPADLNTLFLQTYTNGARIHSDSWGAHTYGSYSTDSRNADLFMWNHPDMLVVFSAGNDGVDTASPYGVIDPGSVGAPGTAKNVLTVGAAESDRAPGSGGYSSDLWATGSWASKYAHSPIDSDYVSQSADGVHQGMAAFSSRGPTDDGRIKPDIVAPGTDVISCRSRAASGMGWGVAANTNYLWEGGTSMSCPLIAGSAALVRQYFTYMKGMTNPSAALIKATLLNGARSLTPGQYGTGSTREIPAAPRPNNVEGWGQGDIEDSLFPAAPRRLTVYDGDRLSTGGSNAYLFHVFATNPVSITLAYTDYPATVGSGVALVNDLDLVLVGPDGTNYFPKGSGAADRLNNVEGIDIQSPAVGLYVVRVSGYNVPYGPQPYALVICGAVERRALNVSGPSGATEGDGVLVAQGCVSVPEAASNDLVVALASSDTNEVTVPPGVTIPAGQTNAFFDLTIVDDTELDGTQWATISTSLAGYGSVSNTMAVCDNEMATLRVAIPANAMEGDGALAGAGMVTVSEPVGAHVTVSLISSDPSEVTAPSAVTVLAGATSAVFTVTVADDAQIDGPKTSWVTAHVQNWADGSNSITVLDNESTNLVVTLPAFGYEGQVFTNGGRVMISGTLTGNLAVALLSADPSEVQVTNTVTLPAGQTSVTFNVTLAGDGVTDGVQTGVVTAGAAGFTPGNASMLVRDSNIDHFGFASVVSPQSAGMPIPVVCSAQDINGEMIAAYQGTAALTAAGDLGPVMIQPTNAVLSNGMWSGSVRVNTTNSNVRLTASDGLGHAGVSNPFDVSVGPVDHFVWGNIAPTQHIDTLFPVTVSARDAGDYAVTSFVGSIAAAGFTVGSGVSVLIAPTNSAAFVNGVWAGAVKVLEAVSAMGLRASDGSGHSGTSGVFMVESLADLSLTMTASSNPVRLGSNLTYVICVSNSGPDRATGVRVTDLLPATVNFISAAASQGTCTNVGRTVTWNSGSVSNGSGATASIVVRSTAYTVMTNTATVIANSTDSVPANNTASTITAVAVPAIWLNPTTLENTWVPTNSVMNRSLTIGNSGGDVLAWSISVPAEDFSDDLEKGSGNWTHGGTPDLWCISTNRCFSTNHAWYCGNDAARVYSNGMDCSLVSPPLTLGAGAKLTFNHWYATESSFDYAYVEISTNNWLTFSTLVTFNGAGNSWRGQTNALSAYAGQEVRIRFRFCSDGSSVYEGWYVDDVVVGPLAPGGTGAWMMVGASNGTVAAAASTNIVVTFNSAGMTNGTTRAGTLVVQSNDPGSPSNRVPVSIWCAPPMGLTVPSQAVEGAGPLLNAGQVSLSGILTSDLVMTLASSDTTEATVPPSVTIRAGQTNAFFNLTIGDDAELDGTQWATITATLGGYVSLSNRIAVLDNEAPLPTLSVVVPATVTEGAGVLVDAGVVTVSGPVVANTAVDLASSDSSEVTVPPSVMVMVGATSAVFAVTVVDDIQVDGPQTAWVTAHVQGWGDGSNSITVQDNDSTNLVVTLPVFGYEGQVLTNGGRVTMGGTLASNLSVALASQDTSEVQVTNMVTLVAGQTSATFNVTLPLDGLMDGSQTGTVLASAAGIGSAGATMLVRDRDLHHFDTSVISSPQAAGSPFSVSLSAQDTNGATIAVYQGPIWLAGLGDSGTVTLQPTSALASNGMWTGNVKVNTPDLNVRLTVTNGVGGGGVSNPFDVLMGPLDHFSWSAVPPLQCVDQPFPVVLTAQDAGGNTVAGFSGNVTLAGVQAGAPITTNILGNQIHDMGLSISYTVGYSFTPACNMTVTHVRHYFGTKVSVWTDDGICLATQTVSSVSRTWKETPLATPVELTGGVRYRVGVYTAGGSFYWRTNSSSLFNNGVIHQGYHASGDAFPSSIDSTHWSLVDLRYMAGVDAPVEVAPTHTGNFVGGVWTGEVAALQVASNMVVQANDGGGHMSSSGLFDVLPAGSVFHLTSGSGPHGGVTPASTNVLVGQTASFLVTPHPYYHSEMIMTNGCLAGSNFGSIAHVYTWSNVTATGALYVAFAENSATNATPQWWLAQYGWTNNFDEWALADPDFDGMTNWQEAIAGTDPKVWGSKLMVTHVGTGAGLGLVVSWPGVSGRVYDVERSTNLLDAAFTPVITNLPAMPPVNVYTDMVPGALQFYRIKVRREL